MLAAISPNCPAAIAATLLPKYARENVLPSCSPSKPSRCDSDTSQESKTLKSSDVEMPPRMRPIIRTLKTPQCFVRQCPK